MAVSVRQFIGGILGSGGSSSETYATIAQLPLAGNVQGSLAFVVENNRLYIWNGTGWFNIALINTNPTITQGPDPTYVFATDGTPIVITLIAEDPEGIPITWSSQVTSGTLGNTAVILQNDNVFTVTPSTDSADAAVFGVTFTASDGVNIATAAASFTLVFSAADSYYNQSILLTTSSVDNANNNVFVDASTNNFAITRVGNTTQGTFGPYSPAGWSGYFDGVGDYLSAPATDILNFGTGDFTIELWLYSTNLTNTVIPLSNDGPSRNVGNVTFLISSGGGGFGIQRITTTGGAAETLLYSSAGSVLENTWNHFAATKVGTTIRLFLNGVLVSTQTSASSSWGTEANPVQIGRRAITGFEAYVTGYISNLRVVKGTALYTANFAPPTEPLTAIANTSLLTLQDNRFKDNSTNNFAITRNGDVRITPFSPFLPTLPYDPATHGGSAYFDGVGDELTVAYNTALNIASSDFTVEFWTYLNTTATGALVNAYYNSSTGWSISFTSGKFYVNLTGDGIDIDGTTGKTPGRWYHIAVSGNGSTGVKLFVDGVQEGITFTGTINQNTSWPVRLGLVRNSINNTFTPLNGYISNLRIVKGTALYTTTFTPPTQALTAIAGTSLLLNNTNAGIFDETGKIVLETVGNAKTSTAVVKYGTTSMVFDGNNDYIKPAPSEIFTMGTGDFTYECWVYLLGTSPVSAANALNIFDNRTAEPSITPNLFVSGSGNGSLLTYYVNGVAVIEATSAFPFNTWTHVALARNGGTTKLYQNGLQIGNAYSDTNNYVGTTTVIGGRFAAVSGDFRSWNGYIQDFRITKGHARYTANFTPPTAQLGYSNPE